MAYGPYIPSGTIKQIIQDVKWYRENTPGGIEGLRTVTRGGTISNVFTGITPRNNPAERSEDNQVGPRRRPVGPRRGYGRGLGGTQMRNVMRP